MINLLIGCWWNAAGPRLGPEQDLEGLLEPAGAVTARDECGVDDPPDRVGLAGFPAHRVDLLLGGQDDRSDTVGPGLTRRSGDVGASRGPERNDNGRPQFVDCVRMVHPRRDFQAMIDRGGEGEKVGRRLLSLSNRLFGDWHRVRDGTLEWGAFRDRMSRLRRDVKRALEQGSRCSCAKTSATCFEILKVEEGLWAFARVKGVEPTNNASERALRHAVIWRRISGAPTARTAADSWSAC